MPPSMTTTPSLASASSIAACLHHRGPPVGLWAGQPHERWTDREALDAYPGEGPDDALAALIVGADVRGYDVLPSRPDGYRSSRRSRAPMTRSQKRGASSSSATRALGGCPRRPSKSTTVAPRATRPWVSAAT